MRPRSGTNRTGHLQRQLLLAAAALLLLSGLAWAAVPRPYHGVEAHERTIVECTDCHRGHKAAEGRLLRARILERACGRCHRPRDIAQWQHEARTKSLGSPFDAVPLTTFPKIFAPRRFSRDWPNAR